MILCDEWTPAQVKAFRLMVNRSVTWADWDEELLALELQEIQESDFDLSLTGFDPGEIDNLLALDDEEKANATPPLPELPVSRTGDLWLLGPHRVLCGDATSAEVVARLLSWPVIPNDLSHQCRSVCRRQVFVGEKRIASPALYKSSTDRGASPRSRATSGHVIPCATSNTPCSR